MFLITDIFVIQRLRLTELLSQAKTAVPTDKTGTQAQYYRLRSSNKGQNLRRTSNILNVTNNIF